MWTCVEAQPIIRPLSQAKAFIPAYGKIGISRGAWVAQSVECPTLAFGSGHDLTVVSSSPESGSVLSVEPAWDSFSLSLSSPPGHALSLSLSLSQRKLKACFESTACFGWSILMIVQASVRPWLGAASILHLSPSGRNPW